MNKSESLLTKSALTGVLIAVVVFWTPIPSWATCAPPAPVPLWWSPAKYETNIPTDTLLYVVPAMEQTLSVTFDGITLVPQATVGTGSIIYTPPSLEPNTTYEFVMEVGSTGGRFGSTTKKIKSNFTTGASSGAQMNSSDVTFTSSSILDEESVDMVSDECNAILNGHQCIDTEGYTTLLIHAESDAVGYSVRSLEGDNTGDWSYWPASCAIMPTVFGPVSEDTCFEVQALYGQGPAPETFITCPLDPAVNETKEDSSGCIQGPRGSSSPGSFLFLLMVLCLWSVPIDPSRWRRASRGAK